VYGAVSFEEWCEGGHKALSERVIIEIYFQKGGFMCQGTEECLDGSRDLLYSSSSEDISEVCKLDRG
jgi:hypothetical protein